MYHFLCASLSRGPACPTRPKTLWSGSWRWSPASVWRPARPSGTPGSTAWRPRRPWRTCSAASLRTSSRGRRRGATAPSRPSPPAPAAPPSPTRPGGCARRSSASSTVATSSSTTAELHVGGNRTESLWRSSWCQGQRSGSDKSVFFFLHFFVTRIKLAATSESRIYTLTTTILTDQKNPPRDQLFNVIYEILRQGANCCVLHFKDDIISPSIPFFDFLRQNDAFHFLFFPCRYCVRLFHSLFVFTYLFINVNT